MLTVMDPALRAHLDQYDGVISAKAATRLGISPNGLRVLVREKVLVRVARGAYVEARLLDPSEPAAHHRHRLRGIVLTRHGALAASHLSAAVLHGLPVLERCLERVRVVHTKDRRNTRSFDTYTVHPCPGKDGLTTHEGVRTVVPALAVIGTALVAGTWSGQMAADAALRKALTTGDELKDWLARMPRHPGVARARNIVDLADPKSESPGESILRLLLLDLGHEVVSQYPIEDADGRVFAYTDFYLPRLRVAVEFDGMVKYGGVEGKRALDAERRRERRIEQRGHGVARVIWSDLYNVRVIAAKIKEARERGRAIRGRS
ncbi:MAG: hypothetical protein DCC50_10800 [Acidobacteria bacterium]|nr:MAG: hypothetical protein DCC50_10800 [Acidobacteriota bacterium]